MVDEAHDAAVMVTSLRSLLRLTKCRTLADLETHVENMADLDDDFHIVGMGLDGDASEGIEIQFGTRGACWEYPFELDDLYAKLRGLNVEIVDEAEVDRVRQPEPEEEDKSRLDILDDPVRMYLKQMGQVPLLTREQEVEISKRIEDNENEVKRIIYGF